MAVIRREPSDDTEGEAAELRQLARDSGMPIETRERRRVAATVHACRAVVAVRLGWPEREEAFLRALSAHDQDAAVRDELSRCARFEPVGADGYRSAA